MLASLIAFYATASMGNGAINTTVSLHTPAILSEPSGHMNCLVVNTGSNPVTILSWGLFDWFGAQSSVGGRLAPFPLSPNQIESIDTIDNGGGAFSCRVVVNSADIKNIKVSIIAKDSSGNQTAAAFAP